VLAAARRPADQLHLHPRNRGKASAIRTAGQATGDYMVILTRIWSPTRIHAQLLGAGSSTAAPRWVYAPGFGIHSALLVLVVLFNKGLTTVANRDLHSLIRTSRRVSTLPLPRTAASHPLGRPFVMEAEVTRQSAPSPDPAVRGADLLRARTREEGKKITWADGSRPSVS